MNGDKFTVLRALRDPPTIYGKKTRGGICVTKTNSCVIIGIYDETKGQSASACNTAVEKLGEYLRSNEC
jgi:hypothetical protein